MKKWNGEYCNDCGESYDTVWGTEDYLWEKITGNKNGNGLLCVQCFMNRAKKLKIRLFMIIADNKQSFELNTRSK